jgi:alanine dehydrogenase
VKVAVPEEIKHNETRVGLTPDGVRELRVAGAEVFVETKACMGSSSDGELYAAACATLVDGPHRAVRAGRRYR